MYGAAILVYLVRVLQHGGNNFKVLITPEILSQKIGFTIIPIKPAYMSIYNTK